MAVGDTAQLSEAMFPSLFFPVARAAAAEVEHACERLHATQPSESDMKVGLLL